MGLSNKLSSETQSFSHCHNPHRFFFQSEVLRLYFPVLEPWVVWPVSLPSCFSRFIHMQMWDHWVLQPLPCCQSSLPWLPISAPAARLCPHTSLNECFFFSSLVVGLPYSLIFWQFWLFFVFKFVVVLLLVVQGGTVYLPMPPFWPEVLLPSYIRAFHTTYFIKTDIVVQTITGNSDTKIFKSVCFL